MAVENKMLNPKEIFEFTKNIGVQKSSRNLMQNLMLSIMAGMFIALGGFAAGVASHGIVNYSVAKLVSGVVFPVGLIMVLICGAELFTGNSLMMVSCLEREISIKDMVKNWVIVYLGNFIGAIIISTLVWCSGALEINSSYFGVSVLKTAVNKANITFTRGIASGILCNMLVCLAVWGAFAAKDVIGKIGIGFFPIMAFVIGGFEHCVANMYYLTLGLMAKSHSMLVMGAQISQERLDNLNILGMFKNLIPVTIGNIIGGAILVAGIYWLAYKKDY